MKLEKLNETLTMANNEPLKIGDKDLTYSGAFVQCLGMWNSKDGRERIRAFQLAQKLEESKGALEISLNELDVLKKSVDNGGGYFVLVLGQLELYLEKTDTKEEKK